MNETPETRWPQVAALQELHADDAIIAIYPVFDDGSEEWCATFEHAKRYEEGYGPTIEAALDALEQAVGA